MTQELIFEESSGNVFADLGLDKADELFTRGKIGIQVIRLIQKRDLKQQEISKVLGISKQEVSDLMKGEFNQFSEGKLIDLLKRLGMEVTLYLRPKTPENQDVETAIIAL